MTKLTNMHAALLLLATLASGAAAPQTPAPQPRQDPAQLREIVADFLKTQTAGLPGEVRITVGAIDQRTQLAACADPQGFLNPGARAWGKTTVGVRCSSPTAWKIFVAAEVNVMADYVASAAPLAQGQALTAAQLVMQKGDLTTLPAGVLTAFDQALGRSPTMSLPAGAPLRADGLRSKPVVQNGQIVRVVSGGAGFQVSTEGRAIGTAGEGQVVQVRTHAGAVLSGIAREGGLVDIVSK